MWDGCERTCVWPVWGVFFPLGLTLLRLTVTIFLIRGDGKMEGHSKEFIQHWCIRGGRGKSLCWFRQNCERQQSFPWETSAWTDTGTWKSSRLNKPTVNFFLQLIKAADSAPFGPVWVEFTPICTKDTKAPRWHTVWEHWRATALLHKPKGSQHNRTLAIAFHNQDVLIHSSSVITNNGWGGAHPAGTRRQPGIQMLCIFIWRQIY